MRRYHGPLGVTFSGNAQTAFNDTTLTSSYTFTTDGPGRPVIALGTLIVAIASLGVHLSGVIGWLLDLLVSLLKPFLIGSLQTQVEDATRDIFTSIITAIETDWPLSLPLGALWNSASPLQQHSTDASFDPYHCRHRSARAAFPSGRLVHGRRH